MVKNLPCNVGDKSSSPGQGTKDPTCQWATNSAQSGAHGPQLKSPFRTDFWILWEKARVGCFERTASKHVYYLW